MHTLEDAKSNYREVFEFKDKYGKIYKRDKKGLIHLNKILDSNFKVMYREKDCLKDDINEKNREGRFSWDSENIYLITSKERLIKISNSEWADFSKT